MVQFTIWCNASTVVCFVHITQVVTTGIAQGYALFLMILSQA